MPLSDPAPPTVVNAIPGGRLPAVTVQLLYGVVPLVAVNVWEYAVPTVPGGSGDVVVIASPEVMVKATEFDTNPPGLLTVIPAVPAFAVRLAGTTAVNCVALKNVVVSNVLLFQTTVDPARNPEPFTVSVSAGPPAVTELGLKLLSVGRGAPMLKVTELEVAPPRLTTLTSAAPGAAIRLAGTTPIT
jgi:hypothetical protein